MSIGGSTTSPRTLDESISCHTRLADLDQPTCQCAVANVYLGLVGGMLITELWLASVRSLAARDPAWSAGRVASLKALSAGACLLGRVIFLPLFFFVAYGVLFTLFLLGLCWWKCENDVLRQSYLIATVPLLDTLRGDFPLFPRSISLREDHLFWRGVYPDLRYLYQAYFLTTLICDLTIGSIAEPDVIDSFEAISRVALSSKVVGMPMEIEKEGESESESESESEKESASG
eukprot:g2744.t1